MKTKTNINLIILLLPVFIILASCEQQKSEWQGTIEEVNGVTVVKNPKEPMYGENVFSLEEELTIGEADGKEEYMFSRIKSISVDEKERIYVLDYGEGHIKIFNKKGDYVQTVGEKGQGPGEMIAPVTMVISNQNEIVVHDRTNRRLNFYSLDGAFIKSLSTAEVSLVDFNINSKGNIIGQLVKREKKEQFFELCKFDSDFNLLLIYGSFPYPFERQTSKAFESTLCWTVSKDDNIVYGYPDKKYEFGVFHSQGKIIRKINKKYNPLKIPKDIKNRIRERTEGIQGGLKLEIPKYYPPYGWVSLDDEDRIFVQTWEETEDGIGYYYDVFNSEGKYIAKVKLKYFLRVWKKRKLYVVESDEDGYQIVKRYKVTWNIG